MLVLYSLGTMGMQVKHQLHSLVFLNKEINCLYFGPSGVRALPLAAGSNEGGHYWSERSALSHIWGDNWGNSKIVVGFQNFALAPN